MMASDPSVRQERFKSSNGSENLVGCVDVATSSQLPLTGNLDVYGVVNPENAPVVGIAANVKHLGHDANLAEQWYVPEGPWFWGADNQESLIIQTARIPRVPRVSFPPCALPVWIRAARFVVTEPAAALSQIVARLSTET